VDQHLLRLFCLGLVLVFFAVLPLVGICTVHNIVKVAPSSDRKKTAITGYATVTAGPLFIVLAGLAGLDRGIIPESVYAAVLTGLVTIAIPSGIAFSYYVRKIPITQRRGCELGKMMSKLLRQSSHDT